LYPYAQFTERARKVLSLAQQEAESSGHRYVGTEHLLLGLLREADGLAAHVLVALGVEQAATRAAIAEVLGEPRLVVGDVLPTARVKKVIELAFEEARRLGHSYVGTEHLLLGLLIEGEGVAAKVLQGAGVTLERVREEIQRYLTEHAHDVPGMPRPPGSSTLTALPMGPDVSRLVLAASVRAATRGSRTLSLDHLLDAMISSAGIEALARLLDVRRHAAAKEQAIASQEYEAAAGHRNAEREARRTLDEAIATWREELDPPAQEAS